MNRLFTGVTFAAVSWMAFAYSAPGPFSVNQVRADGLDDAKLCATLAGEPIRAVDICTQAIQSGELSNGNLAITFYNRALAYGEQRDYRHAIEDYGSALALEPNDIAALNNRGNALVETKQYLEAIRDYDAALKLAPRNAATFNHRGFAKAALGQTSAAIADYTRAIELKPRFSDALLNRAIALSDNGQYDRAIKDFDKLLIINGNHAEAIMGRGLAYEKKGDRSRAIRDFERARTLRPEDTWLLRHLQELGVT